MIGVQRDRTGSARGKKPRKKRTEEASRDGAIKGAGKQGYQSRGGGRTPMQSQDQHQIKGWKHSQPNPDEAQRQTKGRWDNHSQSRRHQDQTSRTKGSHSHCQPRGRQAKQTKVTKGRGTTALEARQDCERKRATGITAQQTVGRAKPNTRQASLPVKNAI